MDYDFSSHLDLLQKRGVLTFNHELESKSACQLTCRQKLQPSAQEQYRIKIGQIGQILAEHQANRGSGKSALIAAHAFRDITAQYQISIQFNFNAYLDREDKRIVINRRHLTPDQLQDLTQRLGVKDAQGYQVALLDDQTFTVYALKALLGSDSYLDLLEELSLSDQDEVKGAMAAPKLPQGKQGLDRSKVSSHTSLKEHSAQKAALLSPSKAKQKLAAQLLQKEETSLQMNQERKKKFYRKQEAKHIEKKEELREILKEEVKKTSLEVSQRKGSLIKQQGMTGVVYQDRQSANGKVQREKVTIDIARGSRSSSH